MSNHPSLYKLRPDKEAVARLFGIEAIQLVEFKPSIAFGLSTIAIHCRHNFTANLDTGLTLRDFTVIPEILIDENGFFYGFAGPCICGKVYYITPTVELLELAESLAQNCLTD